jgi:hypothetical protein
MSHYNSIKTEIRDPACLVTALGTLGFTPRVSETAQPLEGYMGDKRKQTAEIIIPRRQVGDASNDIGFKRREDGVFAAIISDHDRHRYDDKWLAKLKTEYGTAKVIRLAQRTYGCAKPVVKEIKTEKGTQRVLTFTVN